MSLSKSLAQLLGLEFELCRIEFFQPTKVFKFPTQSGHFREVRAGHQFPIRFPLRETDEKLLVRFRECIGEFRTNPFARTKQLLDCNHLTSHALEFVFEGADQINVAREEDFVDPGGCDRRGS